jgi:hypothetical protein
VALAAHRDTAPLAGAVRLLKERLAAGLEDVAAAVAAGRPPQPRPDFDEPLGAVRQALAARQDAEGDAVAFLLGQIVSDTTSLHAAAAPA